MKPTSLAFDESVAAGNRLIPIVLFANAFGVRVWSGQHPPRVADVEGEEIFLDGSVRLDGSFQLGGGLGPILERSGRILEIAALQEGDAEISLEESRGQTDPAGFSVVVGNDDLALSVLEAEENILSAQVRYVVFPPGSVDWIDHVVLGDFRVIEYTLERDRLTLQCREV